jgi:hypothetical protein
MRSCWPTWIYRYQAEDWISGDSHLSPSDEPRERGKSDCHFLPGFLDRLYIYYHRECRGRFTARVRRTPALQLKGILRIDERAGIMKG